MRNILFFIATAGLVISDVAIAQVNKDPNYIYPQQLDSICSVVDAAYTYAVSNGYNFKEREVLKLKYETKSQIIDKFTSTESHPIVKKMMIEAVNRGYYDGLNNPTRYHVFSTANLLQGQCRQTILNNNEKIEIQHSGE
ncbi:hypothetical protein [Paraburkholderia tropica]|uniref:hypothetical protein n=1 Tax=Paraburkholderia tropica TaxID=92647 RepID=UPI002AAF336C|nr:hypothetical protein [Paraburkholderia tropica]